MFIKIHTFANVQYRIFQLNNGIPEFFHIQMKVNILRPYYGLWRISLQFGVYIVVFLFCFLLIVPYFCLLVSHLLSTPLPVFANSGIPFNVQNLQDVKFLGTSSPCFWIIVKLSCISLRSLKSSDP